MKIVKDDMLDVFTGDRIETYAITAGLLSVEAWKAAGARSGLSSKELVQLVARHFRLPEADLSSADNRIRKLIPEKVARRYGVFPLSEDDRNIFVATSDPMNLEAEQAVAFASGRTPKFEIAHPGDIQEAIEKRYSPATLVDDFLDQDDSEIRNMVRVLESPRSGLAEPDECDAALITKLTDLILRDAVRSRASDIHLEPDRTGGTVRYRIDGVMRAHAVLPISVLNRAVARFKVLGNLDVGDHLRPHDGRARVQVEHKTFDLRISTVPTRDCEKAVIRILDPGGAKDFSSLAMSPHESLRFRKLLANHDGIILVTGPTGSGKTTTLYSALQLLANGKVNITTIEDPIEYELAGLTQIQAEPKRGVTFASVLRSILRQDPDIIFVGEIRDFETAEMAVQASMTGHLVLSTLHTNDAVGAVARLIDLGLDRTAIADTLRGVIAQRLVRSVCPNCSEQIHGPLDTAEEKLNLVYGVQPLIRSHGCKKCGQTGFRGRLPIQESLIVTPALQEAILSKAPITSLQEIAVAGGMRTLKASAIARVFGGQTTLQEIDSVVGDKVEPLACASSGLPRVLLVDDDPVTRKVAGNLLEKQGYAISEAADGTAALQSIDGNVPFALIVTDLDMPRMGGREFLSKLKASASTAAIPIVVLTGSGEEETEAALIEQGADDYIRKPIEPFRFVARIKAVLRRSTA